MSKSLNLFRTAVLCVAITALSACVVAAFTWVSGSNMPGASGVYGTQGVAASTNVPGARDGGITWTDAGGNLWLFGGFAGYMHNAVNGDFMNDLWKYSPWRGGWTWEGGSTSSGVQGVYGIRGVAAATNMPGARSNEISWTDGSGNLWLFGGGGTDSTGGFIALNDLWKYSPSSGEWTWEGGSSTPGAVGVYGTKGVASDTNMPGARLLNNTVWTDATGNVWLFGGYGYDSTGTWGPLNDLWEYSPSTGEWTWVSGSNTAFASGSYGPQGEASAQSMPGARYIPVTWKDASGNLWLFGGFGNDSSGTTGELNDLWKYSPSSGEWTWVGGSSTVSPTGVYGTQDVASAANLPPGRNQAAGWTDDAGNFWLFGGEGFNSSTGFFHRLNDLWRYSPSSGEWTWIAGSNTFDATGVYGTQGVPAATNVPGARAAAYRWKDSIGNVWIFGGFQYDDSTNTRFEMNDLWKVPTQ
jgi:N-acetylneuraminic acid mutarotase